MSGTTTVLVRAKLTEKEWASFRKMAIDLNRPVSHLAGEAMRALLKGAKP